MLYLISITSSSYRYFPTHPLAPRAHELNLIISLISRTMAEIHFLYYNGVWGIRVSCMSV